jgi:large subunit ribosomal protein L29
MMKASELNKMSVTELNEELLKLRREQFNLRMQQGTGQLARPDQMSKVRRDIARVKTVINQLRGQAGAS